MGRANIHGSVAPGFEPVREAFIANFEHRREVGAACAVVVGGELVVDLWGGWRDPATRSEWQRDTLVPMFSTTKGVSSLALAHAHSRGLFDYDEPVARYWPEFAQAGKQQVTVRQLLSHQAGLSGIDEPLDLAAIADPERVADALARQRPLWEPGQHHGYHALTLGWYEAELLRRVDPDRRTMGTYFAEELAGPCGLEFYIGLPEEVPAERVAVLQARAYRLRMLLHLHKTPWPLVRALFNPRSISARAFANPDVLGEPANYNRRELWRIEQPASNGIGTPRSVAQIYGEFARGGSTLELRPETLEALTEVAAAPAQGRLDQVLRIETKFSLGFCKPAPGFEFGSSDAAFGTPGAGGSIGYADPVTELGFGYAMNRLDFHLFRDPRQVALFEAAQACAARA